MADSHDIVDNGDRTNEEGMQAANPAVPEKQQLAVRSESVDVPVSAGESKPDADLVRTQQAVTVHHVPGAPLETREDAESSRAYEAELEEIAVDTQALARVSEYEGTDTRSPEANLASRSNIVTDGPGSTGFVGGVTVPEDLPGGEVGTVEQPRPKAQTLPLAPELAEERAADEDDSE